MRTPLARANRWLDFFALKTGGCRTTLEQLVPKCLALQSRKFTLLAGVGADVGVLLSSFMTATLMVLGSSSCLRHRWSAS